VRVLLTGATGVVGAEVCRAIGDRATLHCVARRPSAGVSAWDIGSGPVPDSLTGHWDIIIHAAAATRWTMTRQEAVEANVRPMGAVLALADHDTHVVHVSTAYVGTTDRQAVESDPEFDGYRNGYEWSKALCERELLAVHSGPSTIIRPPLILGRSDDGGIERFSGPYTLMQALVSGLAAVVVGKPTGYAEIAPVDLVARAVADAALAPPQDLTRVVTVAAGSGCMTLAPMVELLCAELNRIRASSGLTPISVPPMVSLDSWRRFFLPLAEQHLSPMQNEAVRLLGMFESYTSMTAPFEPDYVVSAPEEVLVRSLRYWAERKPRLVSRTPRPWSLVG
jgi:nucleoside-diphosphate-sugar epimerase